MVARLLAVLVLLCAAVLPLPGYAEALRQDPIRIPASVPGLLGAGKVVLEALVVRPDGPGPFPLAVINHGSPRDPAVRGRMSPNGMLPQARELARRGWAAVVVMRRGYGGSEGDWAETNGPCKSPDYKTAGEQGADDIRQAIRFLVQQPYVDAKRIISVGVSAGGFATVALTADPPPGLVAAVSFAGGRGSRADDEVCAPERLVDAFRAFGRTSRVPMLWVYAENDHFFGPRLARDFHAAFTGAGGRADFVAAPAFGKDGHSLFSGPGIPQWTPALDRFLAEQKLTPRKTLIDLPTAALPPPPGLSERGRASFQDYLAAAPNKAFAVSTDGAFGWRTARRSEEEARDGALENCAKNAKRTCRVVYVNEAAE
ncbi:CocE/NonD family hydrolase [Azospirillum rugosum]|uniref:Dienelactone hydrolase n=1 Tax=Azospirillum rugosum TaxID=416170 RepID=A0ABS4SMC2_9PROT|nr:CocE/NonD family hydrolase [Azospirillum rugosum]MBP2293077.1 dienelactone hydrolase [Azospirillum rugosum]MDQ0526626.1 dienelactone hydrolase [Azospirillum rugosum]